MCNPLPLFICILTWQANRKSLGSMSYIYIFSAVAFFMLLIACINYMNLTTARSARRAKEIGIRKVTGSTKLQLVAAIPC